MKTIIVVALALLFALSTKPLLGSANAAPQLVLDIYGKKLRADSNYYVVPVSTPDNGGGLVLTSIGDKACPLDVVVVEYQGLPLMFKPINLKKGVVRVSTDLNILFSADTSCPQSTVWKLDDFDASTGQWFVTTGGVVGNPGWQTVRNWFKIEKYQEDYKLVYCPTVCKYCRVQCRDIGVYQDENGNKRLALSYEPLKVQFQPA